MRDSMELQSKGNWNQFKGKLKEAWGVLSDDHLDRYEGKRDKLIGHIQETTGEAMEAIERRFDGLARDSRYEFERDRDRM